MSATQRHGDHRRPHSPVPDLRLSFRDLGPQHHSRRRWRVDFERRVDGGAEDDLMSFTNLEFDDLRRKVYFKFYGEESHG